MDGELSFGAGALLTADEMRAAEGAAMAGGVAEEGLMDAAGAGLAREILAHWPEARAAVIFAGKGHNAGDACVVASHLLEAGWTVELRCIWPGGEWRPLAQRKWLAVKDGVRHAPVEAPLTLPGAVLIDGMLGTGAKGALKGEVRGACRMLNALRREQGCPVFSVDLPTGLDADTGEADGDAVVADVTAALGFAKKGMVRAGAEDFTGRLAVVPLPGVTAPAGAAARGAVVLAGDLRRLLKRRAFSMHKGQAGRVGIVAGSVGLTGAARLAAAAACAAGGGLVTLFCPHEAWPVLAAACPPEVMVKPVNSCLEVMRFPLDAVGVGPGMGGAPLPYLAELLVNDPRPVVVDADALNAMAAGRVSLAGRLGGPRLLTPHPGEWARLREAFGFSEYGLPDNWDAVLLRKSSRSVVGAPNGVPLYNTTGHPAMARGGMGDVLTGFCTAFAAQGMALREAAALGSWLLGRGAELALRGGESVASLSASAVMRAATAEGMRELQGR